MKALKIIGVVLGLAVVAVGGFLAYVQVDGIPKFAPGKIDLKVEVTPERVARGKHFASTLCAECHMNPTTRQLTGKVLLEAPPEFGKIVSKNITQHPEKGIGSWTDGELAYLIRTGIRKDGQYIPPYMAKLPHLADEDLYSIIAFLRSDDPWVKAADVDPPGKTEPSFLTKMLSHLAFRPLPYPTEKISAPAATDKVAYGRYLTLGFECFTCHSGDFKKMNVMQPEKSYLYLGGGNMMPDLDGHMIPTPNLTPDEETGIGRWSEAEFIKALKQGFRPNGTLIRFPMSLFSELSDDEASAIYAYLRTVPKISHAIPKVDTAVADGDTGKKLYYKYGCSSCHASNGIGLADLRTNVKHYPSEDQLKAWIKNAPSIKPDTKMPVWDGVIAEADYPPLMTFVRSLAQ
jgi:mono/diheme cytochrome c family protein